MYASSEFQIAAPAEGVQKQLNWLQADDRGDCGLKVMYKIDASNRYWSATRPTLTSRGHVGAGRSEHTKALLLAAALFCGVSVSWGAQAGSSYLAVWSSDKQNDDHRLNTDFLAIIDADPRSSTYGKVVNTATMERVPGTNLLNDLGFTGALGLTAKYNLPAKGIPSNVLNEAHHISHEPIAVGRHRYLYLGGLISANVFRCDVADPLDIPDCRLITTAKDVKNFSGIDDFARAPNGNLLVTYMGAKDLTTPGGLVELALDGRVVGEYAAAKIGGPHSLPTERQRVTDTGLLAHPHGIDVRPDLNLVVTSDYAEPLSLATSASVDAVTEDMGTTVRFWKLSDLAAWAKGDRAITDRAGP